MIVTTKSIEMQQALLENVGQGMTIYQGVKGYGSRGESKNMEIIHSVINRIDSKKAYRIVNLVDEEAFIIEFDVNNVKGGVLRKYLTNKKQRTLSSTLSRKQE